MKILMTSFFPDVNVWLALSSARHTHSAHAWKWLGKLPEGSRLFYCRYTQMGILRLLSNPAVMGRQTLSLKEAWAVYDQWLEDDRVEFHPEPRGLDQQFREVMKPLGNLPASKAIGDCFLLSFAKSSRSALVTFDHALYAAAEKQGVRAVLPSSELDA